MGCRCERGKGEGIAGGLWSNRAVTALGLCGAAGTGPTDLGEQLFFFRFFWHSSCSDRVGFERTIGLFGLSNVLASI